jgi:hypothetical protein
MRPAARRGVILAALLTALFLAPTAVASAHPLGNFTINHYNGLTIHPDGIDLLAVVDSAEIPTLQQLPRTDTDGDGAVSAAEGRRYATESCADVAAAVTASVGGEPLRFAVRSAEVSYPPGAADLSITRLSCRLTAPADLAQPTTLAFRDGYLSDRIGWREITAVGEGVGLPESPVPATSVSDQLRNYPNDLLTTQTARRGRAVWVQRRRPQISIACSGD